MTNTSKQSALPNAVTRRGGTETSYVGLTSNVSPKVQSPQAENSNTGVSSSFVPKPNHHWFVLRATYGQSEKVLQELNTSGVHTYVPTHRTMKMVKGKKKRVREPLLSNIIFVYTCRSEIEPFVKFPNPTSKYLRYYLDKTKPREGATEKNPPLIVPDNDMRNFIRITSVDNDHIMLVKPGHCHYKSGDIVRIIQGDFAGVIGKVVRAAGQQRVAVNIDGLCTVVTAYIPSDFIQELPTSAAADK